MLRRSIAHLAAATLLASLAVPAAAQDKFVYGVPSAISSAILRSSQTSPPLPASTSAAE